MRFLDARGKEIGGGDLEAVVPQTPVNLRQQVRRPQEAKQVSVYLIDDQGNDRGSLGEASVPGLGQGS
jgi:hypothetical protein